MALSLKLNSDNVLEVNGLFDSLTSAYVNDATVVATLYDRDGVEVTGQSWPLALPYASGTNGIYRGILSDSLALTITWPYRVVITATKDTFVREETEEAYVFT